MPTLKTPKGGASASRTGTPTPVEIPPEKVFQPYVTSIEKKMLKLHRFMADYEGDPTVFDTYKLNTLSMYIEALREQVATMEASWNAACEAGSLSQTAFDEIGALFMQTQSSAEETLDQADKFCIDRAKIATETGDVKDEGMANGPSQDDPPLRTLGKQDGRLDNTLKPDKNLSRTMSLEEATTWITLFESYLEWNKPLL